MNRRYFLRSLGVGALGLAATRFMSAYQPLIAGVRPTDVKNWAWIVNRFNPSPDEWRRQLALMRESGIKAILPEIYESRHAFFASDRLPVVEDRLAKIIPIAKEEGIEVHAWMWSMPCNLEDIVKNHPDWYVVNRKGESAAEKPAYVPYYKFLCPSRPEVHEFLKGTVQELCRYDELTGVHFDYIRFPDVILPTTLQPRYGIVQDREYPEYDYCYCEVCRNGFKEQTGRDPLEIEDPSTDKEWIQYRYDRVTRLVNTVLIPTVHEHKKVASAAVFPNWWNVRQQWSAWNLDAALPMLYHRFYNEGIDWIGKQTKTHVAEMKNHAPIYSGLMVSRLEPEEITEALNVSLGAGGSGVALFAVPFMREEQWAALKEATEKANKGAVEMEEGVAK